MPSLNLKGMDNPGTRIVLLFRQSDKDWRVSLPHHWRDKEGLLCLILYRMLYWSIKTCRTLLVTSVGLRDRERHDIWKEGLRVKHWTLRYAKCRTLPGEEQGKENESCYVITGRRTWSVLTPSGNFQTSPDSRELLEVEEMPRACEM